MDKDINIVQDIKMMQHIVKEAIANCGGDTGGVCINMIGQINIEKGNGESGVPKEDFAKGVAIKNHNIEFSPELIDEISNLADKLPEPRFDSMFKLMVLAASRKGPTQHDAAKWLGITESRYWKYKNKMVPEHAQ